MNSSHQRRTTHAYGAPKNLIAYDRWGSFGRPVVLLHGLRYDRTMWWPVAADLAGSCAAITVDLPGHGESAPRADCDLDRLTHDLAMMISRLDLRRAPVLVGHAEAGSIAEAFAERYSTHVVLTVGSAGTSDHHGDALAEVPELYRQFAMPRSGAGQPGWLERPRAATPVTAGRVTTAHLGDLPFPHLCDPAAFAALVKGMC